MCTEAVQRVAPHLWTSITLEPSKYNSPRKQALYLEFVISFVVVMESWLSLSFGRHIRNSYVFLAQLLILGNPISSIINYSRKLLHPV